VTEAAQPLKRTLPLQNASHGICFYATTGFLAGFSERRAKVLLDSAGGDDSSGSVISRPKVTRA
jgi:hypothetical protein